jgi:hypothetical protein
VFNQQLPDHVRLARGWSNHIMLRLKGHPTSGPKAGLTEFRSVPDMEDASIYRAFQLSECGFQLDLPTSMRRFGRKSNSSVGTSSDRRKLHGFVLDSSGRPIAELCIVDASDRFKDHDPTNTRDFESFASR